MSLLEVHNVMLRFGGVTAVDGVSLAADADRLLGVIGPNGAGKTTLLHIITGVLRAQQGRVRFAGQDITDWPVHRRIRAGLALSRQMVKPLKSLTLLDNVTLAAGVGRMANPVAAMLACDRSAERRRATAVLEAVGIADAANTPAAELPLGYLKRLEVARALALQPRLLLLDEPLAGLGPVEAAAMADLIAGLVGNGRGVILIEHNIREVARICTALYVQDNGRKLLAGPTAEVMRSAELKRAYLGGEHT